MTQGLFGDKLNLHMSVNFYLVKSDPKDYSLQDLKKDKKTVWDGVYNYQAINTIKQWKPGDLVFIYHSQGENNIVGLSKVISYPRENKESERFSWVADIEFYLEFPLENLVSLKEIKESGLFQDFSLVKQPRLSVMSCPDEFVEWIRKRVSI